MLDMEAESELMREACECPPRDCRSTRWDHRDAMVGLGVMIGSWGEEMMVGTGGCYMQIVD